MSAGPGGRRRQRRATSQVFQDALSLPERGLALLGRLLCQSFSSISSSQKLICSLADRNRNSARELKLTASPAASSVLAYLLFTPAFLQQFADFLLLASQVVSQLVVVLLSLVDQLVQVRCFLLDLRGFLLEAELQSDPWQAHLASPPVDPPGTSRASVLNGGRLVRLAAIFSACSPASWASAWTLLACFSRFLARSLASLYLEAGSRGTQVWRSTWLQLGASPTLTSC